MKTKNTLTFLVGPPGAGKTTYAKKYLKNDNTIILSSDELRQKLLGDETDQSDQKLIFDTLYKMAKDELQNGKNVVLDSTNTNKILRTFALQLFEDFDAIKIAIVFKTPIEECLKRDSQRKRAVGKKVINRFFKYISYPTEDENFDKIIEIE